MKILMILNYGWDFGGGETQVLTLKKELERRGNNVIIFSSDNNPNKKHFSDYEFKECDSFPLRFFKRIFNMTSLKELKQVLKKENPDIVHIHSISEQVSPSIFLALKNIPTIMTIHSSVLSSSDLKLFSIVNLERRIRNFLWRNLKSANHYIFPSNFMHKYFKSLKLKNPTIIHNGIELFNYSKIKNYQSLLYVGRLSEEKGVNYLINAMSKIIEKFPNCILKIAGDGPDMTNLKNKVIGLKLNKNVKFLGKVSHGKIKKLYENSSIIIVPSLYKENFPTVILEAMSTGRVIIGTTIGGIPEMISNKRTGYLVPPKNSKEITEKTIQLLDNPQLMQKMGITGRRRIESNFSIEKHVSKLQNVYKNAIKKN